MSRIELRGKLIVFEGLDFTGKSTQVRLLAEQLRSRGLPVVTTREPGGTPIGEEVRKLLLSRNNSDLLPLSELLLLITCRAQVYAQVIKPGLAEGAVVVSSRYRLSSLAYQGYGRGLSLELIHRLNDAATEGRKPDITFLIDLPAEIALGRRKGKGDRIEGEDLEFYRRVRQGYLELTRGDRTVVIIDGRKSVREIASEVTALLGV